MTGPVQVLVVGFDQPTYSGAVLAELRRLEQAGVVRLIDLLVVSRAADGSIETVEAPDVTGLSAGSGQIAAALLGTSEDTGAEQPTTEDHSWSLGDVVPIGQVAAVALVEHLWASTLRTAMRENGARPLDETWLGPDDLARLDLLVADSQS
jgi:hypothetical protein